MPQGPGYSMALHGTTGSGVLHGTPRYRRVRGTLWHSTVPQGLARRLCRMLAGSRCGWHGPASPGEDVEGVSPSRSRCRCGRDEATPSGLCSALQCFAWLCSALLGFAVQCLALQCRPHVWVQAGKLCARGRRQLPRLLHGVRGRWSPTRGASPQQAPADAPAHRTVLTVLTAVGPAPAYAG